MTNIPNGPELPPIAGGHEVQGKSHKFTLERVYPALVFVPLFYLAVRYFPPTVFFLLIIIVASLAFLEFTKVTLAPPPSPIALGVGMAAIWLLLAGIQWTTFLLPTIMLTILVVALLVTFMFIPPKLRQCLPRPMAMIFGIGYMGICLGHLLLIRKLESGDLLIFFVLIVTWAADIGGYYIGASMGRRPIAPRLSPKKTIEGFIAGVIFSVILALVSHLWFLSFLTIHDCIIIGIVLACVGLIGDLAESAFKRNAGIKDSGSLIPGHGGVLDRIDSLLLTAPAFYYYILLINGTSLI